MEKLNVRSDAVIASGVKLKDYIKTGINEVSDDYIEISHMDGISKEKALEYVMKYRNMLLCINEICKSRKKF